MPTIVGILTCISRINKTSESNKERKISIFVFMSNWNFMISWVEHEKKFYNLGAWLCVKESGMSVMGLKDFNVL